MVKLSKYVRTRLEKKMREVKKELPLLKDRLVVARAVRILEAEEEVLKELAKDK
jgi:hypothetical protein